MLAGGWIARKVLFHQIFYLFTVQDLENNILFKGLFVRIRSRIRLEEVIVLFLIARSGNYNRRQKLMEQLRKSVLFW